MGNSKSKSKDSGYPQSGFSPHPVELLEEAIVGVTDDATRFPQLHRMMLRSRLVRWARYINSHKQLYAPKVKGLDKLTVWSKLIKIKNRLARETDGFLVKNRFKEVVFVSSDESATQLVFSFYVTLDTLPETLYFLTDVLSGVVTAAYDEVEAAGLPGLIISLDLKGKSDCLNLIKDVVQMHRFRAEHYGENGCATLVGLME